MFVSLDLAFANPISLFDPSRNNVGLAKMTDESADFLVSFLRPIVTVLIEAAVMACDFCLKAYQLRSYANHISRI